MTGSGARPDLRVTARGVEERAAERRSATDGATELESELDTRFARLLPKGSGKDFAVEMRHAAKEALFDLLPPVDSSKPGGRFAKQSIAKLSGWYVRYLAQQMTEFAVSITNAVRILGDRTAEIEARVAPPPFAATLAGRRQGPADAASWSHELVGAMKGATGRVLVVGTEDPAVLDELSAAGTEIIATSAAGGADRGAVEELLAPLLVERDLGGAVFVGFVDALSVAHAFDLLRTLAAKLPVGAPVALVTTDPEHWRRDHGGLLADLAAARPLAAATWVELLREHGFGDIEIVAADPGSLIEDVPGSDRFVTSVNAQLRALEAAIAVPPSYCIRARRA